MSSSWHRRLWQIWGADIEGAESDDVAAGLAENFDVVYPQRGQIGLYISKRKCGEHLYQSLEGTLHTGSPAGGHPKRKVLEFNEGETRSRKTREQTIFSSKFRL